VALEALHGAVARRRPAAGLVHHSDRGGSYASANYQELLDQHGMVCSMSRPGNCLDNAPAESFFHSLKTEWLYHFTLYSRAQARSRVFEYFEGFYNRTRLYFALGYRSPEQYEKLVVTHPRVHFFGGISVRGRRFRVRLLDDLCMVSTWWPLRRQVV